MFVFAERPSFFYVQTVADSYEIAVDSLTSRLQAREEQVETLSQKARRLVDSGTDDINAEAVVKGNEGLMYAQDVLEEKVGEVSLFQAALESKLDGEVGSIPKGIKELRNAGSETGIVKALDAVSCISPFVCWKS
jgi:hypothetical protein